MARDLALPRSTTYHLLQTMMDAGYVTHYPDQQVYGLGLAAYELASGYMRREPLQRLARRPLADLADRSGHSAHLSVLHGREVVYVIEERAPGRARLITDVGVRLPAHTTASGRAMLAQLPPAQVRALYPSAKELSGSTTSGPRTPIELRRLLSDVRHEGFASEEGEVTAGQSSLARAVVDASGYPVVAVAVTYPVEDRSEALLDGLTHHLDRTVHTLAQRLGGRAVTRPAGGARRCETSPAPSGAGRGRRASPDPPRGRHAPPPVSRGTAERAQAGPRAMRTRVAQDRPLRASRPGMSTVMVRI
ncbi:IclR family transcriptional regulator [Nocardioides sp. B-3]|nr:IclR family transcriptional regulator [Nocardioides sp. B-3]